MIIKEILEILKKEDPETILNLGWEFPHSYRGYYHELGVEPKRNVKIKDMIKCLEASIGNEFEGWKGGLYRMTEYSDVYLAKWGECGEEIGEYLLEYMLKDRKMGV